MKTAFAEKLCCPIDKQALELKVFLINEHGDIIEGLFTCVACSRYYPVVYGIPIMTPDEYREKALEEPVLKKWGIDKEKTEPEKFLLRE